MATKNYNRDHDAILKAYPDVTLVTEDGAFKTDGTEVTLVQSALDAARTTLDAEAVATKYQRDRTGVSAQDTIYPSIGDQLDALYKDIVAGTVTTSGAFATAIKAVKDKYPKP